VDARHTLGDGQPQSDPTGLAVACVGNAIERAKDVAQLVGGHAWAAIGDQDDGCTDTRSFDACDVNIHGRGRRRVPNGVPDDVLKQYGLAYTEKELKECVSFT